MKKLSILLSIISALPLLAEETIKLDKSVIKGSPRTADYSLIPKEQKNTFVITKKKLEKEIIKMLKIS